MIQKPLMLAAGLAVVLLASALMPQQSFAVKLKDNHFVGQHVPIDESLTIDNIEFSAKKKTAKTDGTITVSIVQDGITLATADIDSDMLKKTKYKKVLADFDDIAVTDDFDVVISFGGEGGIHVKDKTDKRNKVAGNLFEGEKERPKKDLKLEINAEASNEDPDNPLPPPPQGTITISAYRIPSEHWGPTFSGANAEMYFVLYDSEGTIVWTGFANEDGNAVTGLAENTLYYVYPTDCDSCHGGQHDVEFRYWEDSSTERPRGVTTNASVGAYFEYVPHEPQV